MNLATFRTLWPEFESSTNDLVQGWLTIALNEVDSCVYGCNYDLAHGLMTAHHLALSPKGKNARLTSGGSNTIPGMTTYKKQLDELRFAATAGVGRVI